MLSIPRALPPVTHGSALQAPECLRGTCDVITFQAPERLWDVGAQIRPIRGGRKKRIPPGDADGHLPGGMIMVCGLNSVITSG